MASRIPFLNPADPGWDESTFILLGQSIVDGHLPYIELWDLKPPLVFYLFAIPIKLFGKSLIGIRALGLLCVATSALLLYYVGKRTGADRIGVAAAVLLVFTIGVVPAGQQVMTEHLAIVPLTAALWVATTSHSRTVPIFSGTGFFLGVACLVRLNLAYTALFVGLVLLFIAHETVRASIVNALAYALGGALPVFLTFLPHWLTGTEDVWCRSVIVAPLAYSTSQLSFWDALAQQFHNGFGLERGLGLTNVMFFVGLLVWGGGALGLCSLFLPRRKYNHTSPRTAQMVVTFAVGTTVAIGMGGAAHPHYLIQLIPFFAIGAAYGLNQALAQPRQYVTLAVALGLTVIAFRPVPQGLYRFGIHMLSDRPELNGTGRQIAEFINTRNPSDLPIFLLTNHIAYWYLDSIPLHKLAVHPSNIAKEFLFPAILGNGASSKTLLIEILGRNPEFIVTKDQVWYLEVSKTEGILEQCLDQKYALVHEINGRKIYRLKEQIVSPSERIRPVQSP